MAGSGGPRRHRRVREAAAPRYAADATEGVAGVLYDSDVIVELLRGRAVVVEAARRLEGSGVTTYCGRVAGSYLARFARSHGLELGDALIAAAATTSGVRLWTRNRKHYPMADLRFHQE